MFFIGKGGAIVIQNRSNYIAECERQLNNPDHYKKLHHNPTEILNNKILRTLQSAVQSKDLTEEEAIYLFRANQLMDNLIEFLDNYPDAKLVVADEKNHQSPTDEEIPPVSPKISFPDEDLVDIITDESWTILDTVGETPAPEDVFPITHEDFTDFLY